MTASLLTNQSHPLGPLEQECKWGLRWISAFRLEFHQQTLTKLRTLCRWSSCHLLQECYRNALGTFFLVLVMVPGRDDLFVQLCNADFSAGSEQNAYWILVLLFLLAHLMPGYFVQYSFSHFQKRLNFGKEQEAGTLARLTQKETYQKLR